MAPEATAPGAPSRTWSLAALLVCAAGAAAFASALGASFTFDDVPIILDNPLVHSLRKIPRLWTTDYWAGVGDGYGKLYRPLVLTSFAVNHALASTSAVWYHAVNVALHLLVSLVLLRVGRDLGLAWPGALAGTLIFVVHPIHVEAVTGLVGRAELLMALGVLLGWHWHRQSVRGGGIDRRRTALSCAALALGVFSKEQAALLPALLVISDAASGRGRDGAPRFSPWLLAQRYGGHALVLVAYLLLRRNAFDGDVVGGGHLTYVDNPLLLASTESRVATALVVAGRYLALMAWPAHLSADYSYDAIPLVPTVMAPGALAGLLAWTALVALGVWGFRRGRPALALGAALCVLTFLPVSNLPLLIGTIMGERLFYLPSAGLCLMLGDACGALHERMARPGGGRAARWAPAVALAVVVAALGVRTHLRNLDWRDNITLFLKDIVTTPGSFKLQTMAADKMVQVGRIDEAQALLEVATARVGDVLPESHALLGKIYDMRGRHAEAQIRMETAAAGARRTQHLEGETRFLLELGAFYMRRLEASSGQASPELVEKAERTFIRALAIAEKLWGAEHVMTARALNNLAAFYASRGQYDRAEPLHRRALEMRERLLGPEDADVGVSLGNLGLLYYSWGRLQDAEPLYRRSIAVLERARGASSPELVPRLETYAAVLDKLDRPLDALAARARARAIQAQARSDQAPPAGAAGTSR